MTGRRMMRWAPLLVAALAASGCKPDPLHKRFQSADPSVRMGAVLEVGRLKDRQSVPYLVDRLTDSEADIRFAAILALEKITGTRRGYRYFAPSAERAEAVRRWRQWLNAPATSRPAGQPTTQPATQPAEDRQ